MNERVVKAVIPAAGLGTRFLPATKAMPKEMLPVVDKPAIQYVVEEAAGAGLHDVLIVVGRNKNTLANHFDSVPELESNLRNRGEHGKLGAVQSPSQLADMHFVRQGEPKGLGHAVLRAQRHVGDHPFAVLLGDDLIDERDALLTTMVRLCEEQSVTVVALMEVDPGEIQQYGAAVVEPTDRAGVVRVTGLVEKPAPGEAPSNLAVIGRYVLRPEVFAVLATTPPGRGDEIQLTDALHRMASERIAGGVLGVLFSGRRYDTGDRLGWIMSTLRLGVDRPDIGPALRERVLELAAELTAESTAESTAEPGDATVRGVGAGTVAGCSDACASGQRCECDSAD